VLLESHDAIEAGVGLACANALANRDEPGHTEGDILEQLDVRPEEDVPDEVLRVVSEGGGMRQFSPYVRKVTVKVDSLTRASSRA